jgi:putative tryptophan/tyrosine transport system substrate-binding protein
VRRRRLLALAGATACTVSHARAADLLLVGVLTLISRYDNALWHGFYEGLREQGFVEGRDFIIDALSAEGHFSQLRPLAAQLVERRVAVIYAPSGVPATALAARQAAPTTPVVFVAIGDPVRDGTVTGFDGPNANLTGVALLQNEAVLKQVELLAALRPGTAPLAVLVDPAVSGASADAALVALQKKVDRRFIFELADDESDFEVAFETFVRQRAAGVVVAGSFFFSRRHRELAALAARHALPALYPDADSDLAASGGLMSYGPSVTGMFRIAGATVAKILKGARPEALPVQRPARNVLKVNLRTARTLGITLPPSLLATADERIE